MWDLKECFLLLSIRSEVSSFSVCAWNFFPFDFTFNKCSLVHFAWLWNSERIKFIADNFSELHKETLNERFVFFKDFNFAAGGLLNWNIFLFPDKNLKLDFHARKIDFCLISAWFSGIGPSLLFLTINQKSPRSEFLRKKFLTHNQFLFISHSKISLKGILYTAGYCATL
jgi:hypothetical protein